jgi:putative membrane protein
MGDVLLTLQPWIKAFHVLAVISWMAAMLYLPRLFVNHAGLEASSQASELLKGMEDRLYRLIMNPAMLAALAAGVVLAILGGPAIWTSLWFWVKGTASAGERSGRCRV